MPSTKYNKVKEVYAQYSKHAMQLVEDAEIQDETYWECPMCWGEGSVSHCVESKSICIGELECAGIQMYGIGAGVNDIQTLLSSLLLLSPKMFEVINAAMKVVDIGKSEIPQLVAAVAALREE